MSFEDYKANELIHENTVIDNKKATRNIECQIGILL